MHDKRYLLSISRSPLDEHFRGPNFSTGCEGDSGGPVFYEEPNGSIKLVAIHHSGPIICGDAVNSFDFDSSALMIAVQNDCF